ncbi:MAG: preprotein translocase subunit SecE [Acidobacteria bacterium]|nr:preprotein translocase subunit SecE [Acidobacteriota bacterium]
MSWLVSVRQFWREVVLELKKVSWPTRTEVINTTIITIVVVFFFALFLVGADIVLSYLISGIEWGAKKILG